MEELVMGLFVVQVLGGAYLFMSVAAPRSQHSTARATRLPPLVVFSHATIGVVAPALWLGYLTSDATWVAWATFGSLLLSIAGGLHMLARTVGRSDRLHALAADPADVRVAEKQVPAPVLAGHGLVAALLLVLTLLVALGA